MSAIPGKSVLADLLGFSKSDVKKWFNKAIPNAMQAVSDAYANRNEVILGGVFVPGTVGNIPTATALKVNSSTAIDAVLAGKIKAQIAALAGGVDLLATAGDVGQPLMSDGTTGFGIITLAADEAVKGAIILVNSDGAGGVDDADEGAALIVVVFAGATQVAAKAATAFPTSVEIANALAASTGVHAGTTSWQHLAQVDWADVASTVSDTFTGNRNNALGV